MPELKELGSGLTHWVGSYGSLVIAFWLSEIDPEACSDLARVARRWAMGQPDRRVSVLSVSLSPVTGPRSDEARNALRSLHGGTGGYVSRVAVYHEVHGFVASA